jgi:hypothetical protein
VKQGDKLFFRARYAGFEAKLRQRCSAAQSSRSTAS